MLIPIQECLSVEEARDLHEPALAVVPAEAGAAAGDLPLIVEQVPVHHGLIVVDGEAAEREACTWHELLELLHRLGQGVDTVARLRGVGIPTVRFDSAGEEILSLGGGDL